MLGELITERMEELGLRQSDVARKSALSRQYISDLIAGKRGGRLSVATQIKLARALRLTPARLAARVANAESAAPTPEASPNARTQ